MGYSVSEERIAMEDIVKAARNGKLEECFGTGTAAVVSPVGELVYNDEVLTVADGGMGKTTELLYNTLTGIQYGRLEDKFGWMVEL